MGCVELLLILEGSGWCGSEFSEFLEGVICVRLLLRLAAGVHNFVQATPTMGNKAEWRGEGGLN